MSFRFLFGGSGSGKTETAFREIIEASVREPDRSFFVIVPEQYSMQMQKRLLDMHPDHATENIDVLSFNRLAYRVFHELNIVNPDSMDDAGKAMILRRVAAEHGKELTVWKEQFKKPGFVNGMKSMISELYQYGIRPEDLENMIAGNLKPVLKQKLSDMLVMYRGFSDFIRDRFITTEELLDIFARVMQGSGMLRGSVIYLDGFTGFTPVQYRILEQFLTLSDSMTVTVTIGAEKDPYHREEQEELFSMSTDMVAKITDLASANGVSHGTDIFLKPDVYPRFRESAELAFLERHFLRYDGVFRKGPCRDIRISMAMNPKEEAALAAEKILDLVKREEYRYREIALISGDPAHYNSELKHEFMLQGIPCYADENVDISDNPLPEFLRSAIGVMTDSWSYNSIIRFLKSGLVPEEKLLSADGQTDMLHCMENYMLECGIRGKGKMEKPWTFVPKDMAGTDMEALNACRETVAGILKPLADVFSDRKATVKSITETLKDLLKECNAEEKLKSMQEKFRLSNDIGRTREYEKVWPEVMHLFDQMEELLGEEPVLREEYAGILDAGLKEIRVGMIPACADRVSVGDLVRSRLSEIRVLFVLGVNDGIIPKAGASSGVLTDHEKEILAEAGMVLAPTAKQELYTQRYYLYRMLSQPKNRLFISFPGMDSQGKSLNPSGILNRIRALFPDLALSEKEPADESGIFSGIQAERILADCMREDKEDALFRKLAARFGASDSGKRKYEILSDAAAKMRSDEQIGEKAARNLYGDILSGSVTRFEDYAECPCAHFLKYGIGLTERHVFEIEAADIGNLAHESVEIVFRRAEKEHRNLSEMQEEERDAFVEECVGEALCHDDSGLYSDSARNDWIAHRLAGIARRSVWTFSKQIARGDFKPFLFEKSFSDRDGLKSMDLSLSDGMKIKLRGQTDRVDIAEDGKNILLKIIDYKTGSVKWEPYKILDGSQIQLLLYMDAMSELFAEKYPDREILPAAMLYQTIGDPLIDRSDASTPEEVDRETIKKLKPSGLLNSDPDIMRHFDGNPETLSEVAPVSFKKDGTPDSRSCTADTEQIAKMKAFVRRKIIRMGEEIMQGNISVTPSMTDFQHTACTYCPYGAVCGFDRKTEGYEYRREKKLSPDEVLKEMEK